jgi:hypothetical protein
MMAKILAQYFVDVSKLTRIYLKQISLLLSFCNILVIAAPANVKLVFV